MKTLKELKNEIKANEELKQAFKEALLNGTVTEFIAAQGVEATPEEIKAALSGFAAQTLGEISDEEMANVAGGSGYLENTQCPRCGSNRAFNIADGYIMCVSCFKTSKP